MRSSSRFHTLYSNALMEATRSIPTSNIPIDYTPARKTQTTTRKSKRPQTSMIWTHHKPSTNGVLVVDKDGDIVWRCLYCLKQYKNKSGTRKAILHLQISHNITNDRVNQSEDRSPPLEARNPIDTNTLKDLYLEWTASHPDARRQAQTPAFRLFLEYATPFADTLLSLDVNKEVNRVLNNNSPSKTTQCEEENTGQPRVVLN